jgi:two-component system, NarL family, uhpT operon response regulator UhpA
MTMTGTTTPQTGVPVPRVPPDDVPTERVIRVGIVDDHRLMLDALSSWLGSEAADISVEIAASTWPALVGDPRFPVDVVLLDLDLGDGVPVGSKIVRLGTVGVAAVVVSTFADPRRVRECLAAGALGFVPKSEDATEIPRAIRAAAAGEGYVTPALAALLVAAEQDPHAEPPPPLSQQERRALVLYASGLPLKSVAEHLDISTETAKTYLGRVRDKYAQAGREARTKIALHRRAVEDGLLPADPTPSPQAGA